MQALIISTSESYSKEMLGKSLEKRETSLVTPDDVQEASRCLLAVNQSNTDIHTHTHTHTHTHIHTVLNEDVFSKPGKMGIKQTHTNRKREGEIACGRLVEVCWEVCP